MQDLGLGELTQGVVTLAPASQFLKGGPVCPTLLPVALELVF